MRSEADANRALYQGKRPQVDRRRPERVAVYQKADCAGRLLLWGIVTGVLLAVIF